MFQDVYEWLLILLRWVHITVAVTWIGESIFFMWLDRSFVKNENSTRPGHVGELWMVHGGGFYHVEKLLMGPTKVPERLHWFKWESYATWMSGTALMGLIFYTGDGTFLLDESVSSISYGSAVVLSIVALFGSWLFYDFLWELKATRDNPKLGHALTIGWFLGMTFVLCNTLSGRAAFLHIGAMLGTWMTANVFMRIIPRQLKMVEASKRGEPVNQDWGKNAKNRSTHNTYFTLPVIFIMLSNHFPSTYGHDYNWLILILLSAVGASVREFFVVREQNRGRALAFAMLAFFLFVGVLGVSKFAVKSESENESISESSTESETGSEREATTGTKAEKIDISALAKTDLSGTILFEGDVPAPRKLTLPSACAKQYQGDAYSREIIVTDGKLKNVLVRLINGHQNFSGFTLPANKVQIDQRGCQYHPKVTAVAVGQPVEFVNSDPVFHNVRSRSKVNDSFNINMPKLNQKEVKVFTSPELPFKTKCSLHPWMGAHIGVFAHPWFSVSAQDGSFNLKGIPDGNYTVEAWHEVLGRQTRTIKIIDGNHDPISFTFRSNK